MQDTVYRILVEFFAKACHAIVDDEGNFFGFLLLLQSPDISLVVLPGWGWWRSGLQSWGDAAGHRVLGCSTHFAQKLAQSATAWERAKQRDGYVWVQGSGKYVGKLVRNEVPIVLIDLIDEEEESKC